MCVFLHMYGNIFDEAYMIADQLQCVISIHFFFIIAWGFVDETRHIELHRWLNWANCAGYHCN